METPSKHIEKVLRETIILKINKNSHPKQKHQNTAICQKKTKQTTEKKPRQSTQADTKEEH